MRKTIEERFWEKVEVRGEDECWEWQAAHMPFGYGNFWGGNALGYISAHKMSMLIAVGVPPEDKPYVLHACDNPPCVNPRHLRYDTQKANTADAIDKRDGVHWATGQTWSSGPRDSYKLLEFCKRGHPRSGDNLRINKGGGRECKSCSSIKRKERYYANLEGSRLKARLQYYKNKAKNN